MFCLNYYPFQPYLEDAQELRIKYRPADRTLKDFLEAHQNKSIVIDVSQSFEQSDAELFKMLYEKFNNIKLIINYFNEQHLARVQEYKIPFFFSTYVSSIDQLHGLLKYHPTDMYICEELGFFLDKVSAILHKENVRVRVFPNICQSSFRETESIKTFFIRPEDIQEYMPYVDVFQLVSDEKRQEVLYKVYKHEKWFGKISEIIPTFKDDLDSRYVMGEFGTIRSKCGKRCMYKPGSCNICERYMDLAETFQKNYIIVKRATKNI